jgi:hypothetical protein
MGLGPQHGETRVHVTYKPSAGTSSIEIYQGGSIQATSWATGSTTGGALAAPTDFYLGSSGGSSGGFSARWRSLKTGTPSMTNPELMIVGDSMMAFADTATTVYFPQIGSLIYTTAESRTRGTTRGIISIAHSGDKAQDQETAFSASPFKTTVPYVYIQVGINNIAAGESSATTISNIQSLVDTVHSTNPTAKILIGKITPCKTWLDANTTGGYTKWGAINTAIGGGGGSPITSIDVVVDGYMAILNNGSDDFADQYNAGDYLHPSRNAKDVIATYVRTEINGLGF